MLRYVLKSVLLISYMDLGFYIEYPSLENIQKIQMIDFPINTYLASPNLLEFRVNSELIRELDETGVVKNIWYWPVLTEREGYTISPFVPEEGLRRILNEINECNTPLNVLIDAELPICNPSLILRGVSGFTEKKQILHDFFKTCRDNETEVMTAECPPIYNLIERLEKNVGISYNPHLFGNKRTWMCYSSIGKYFGSLGEKTLLKGFEKLWANLPDDTSVSLGCLGKGQLKNEPVITSKQLGRELELLTKTEVPEIIFYRLGGLNKEYLEVITNTLN